MNYEDVIAFWFQEIDPEMWWNKDDDFDQLIVERFAVVYRLAAQGELFMWRSEPLGRLAEIIVLDQFSRNMYRGRPESFAMDTLALVLSQEAVYQCVDQSLLPEQKSFLYMPFMHSESATIHEEAVKLFNKPGLENNLKFEYKHKNIIDKFGRYPHRNEVLGRISTHEELEFLKQPGSSF